ncbi:MAG TPA: hypothetical protein P5155_01130 [Candidatus Absconditabacterales bacterium]|nr:hypothetical protein [Candidatus Absconditabacterales bacterium]
MINKFNIDENDNNLKGKNLEEKATQTKNDMINSLTENFEYIIERNAQELELDKMKEVNKLLLTHLNDSENLPWENLLDEFTELMPNLIDFDIKGEKIKYPGKNTLKKALKMVQFMVKQKEQEIRDERDGFWNEIEDF